jgi:hypothetical protein
MELHKFNTKAEAAQFVVRLSLHKLTKYVRSHKHRVRNMGWSKEENIKKTIRMFFQVNPTLGKLVMQTPMFQNNDYTNLVNYAKGNVLQWKLDPSLNDRDPYNFTVQASEDIVFNEFLYEEDVGNSFMYIDRKNIKQTQINTLFYRIKLTTGDNVYYSQTFSTDIRDYTRRQFVMAAEIVRKERTYIKATADNTVDPISGLAITSAENDFGTAKVDGYYNPIAMVFSTSSGVDVKRLAPEGTGVLEISTIEFRALGYPICDVNDIIVETEQDRCWIIKDRQAVYFPASELVLVQKLKLSLIPNTDPVYSIKVPVHTYDGY